jgi:hypothetical protein
MQMPKMREKVETQMKPVLDLCRTGRMPHGRLLADGIQIAIDQYEETFRAMDEGHKRLCWYEFCLTPELFLAMDIVPFLGESHPLAMTRGTPEVCWAEGGIHRARARPVRQVAHRLPDVRAARRLSRLPPRRSGGRLARGA